MSFESKIITIGREYGSGGHEIGKQIATLSGVPFYDGEILTRMAAESGLCKEVIQKHDERMTLGHLFANSMTAGTSAGMISMDVMGGQMNRTLLHRVFMAQFETLQNIANEGPCVIVGRCADYVLKEYPNVFHVFIYASAQARIERIMKVRDLSQEQAKENIKKVDKERKNYYNFFADGNWGLRTNYDLMIRSDGIEMEQLAKTIIEASKGKTME